MDTTHGANIKHGSAPLREPITRTLRRNLLIALAVGAALALRRQDIARWLPYSVLAIWFSLGGHYVEVFFLNVVRHRISSGHVLQRLVRFVVWFVGGAVLFVLMAVTARAFWPHVPRLGLCWIGGLALIGIELIAHAVLWARKLPNIYRGDG